MCIGNNIAIQCELFLSVIVLVRGWEGGSREMIEDEMLMCTDIAMKSAIAAIYTNYQSGHIERGVVPNS